MIYLERILSCINTIKMLNPVSIMEAKRKGSFRFYGMGCGGTG